MLWMFAGRAAAAIAADAQASADLANSRAFVATGPSSSSPPSSWDATSFTSFKSLATLEAGLANGGATGARQYVMYDNENWWATPLSEQKDPAGSMEEAANLSHLKGMKFISAPGVDIVHAIAPNATNIYDQYLSLDIAGEAARYADVFVIQAQGLETNAQAYANFVKHAEEQAAQVNPHAIILAGLSTQPNGVAVNASAILADINLTKEYVAGYWLNVPGPGSLAPHCTQFLPGTAISVLHALG